MKWNSVPANLAFGLLLSYLFVAGGHLYSMDDHTNFYVSQALWMSGSPEVKIVDVDRHLNLVEGSDGRLFSDYGIGGPLVYLPFVLAGRAIGLATGRVHYLSQAGMSLTNAAMTVLAAVLLFQLAMERGTNRRWALAVACLYGLASPALVWTKYSANSVMVGTFFLATSWLLMRGRPALMVVAGMVLSLAVNVRYDAVLGAVLIPLILLAGRRGSARDLALVILGALPGLGLLLGHNFYRFGDPFVLGYSNLSSSDPFGTPLGLGVYGLLLSPNRGLVFHAPVLIFALLGIGMTWRVDRRFALLAGLVPLLYVGFFGKAESWDGGVGWGPRYLGCVLPLLCLGFVVMRLDSWSSWLRSLFRAVAVVSVLLQLWGTAVSMDSYHDLLVEAGINPVRSRDEVALAPVWGLAWVMQDFTLEPATREVPVQALEPGGHPVTRSLRSTPDYWAFYAWKLGLPAVPLLVSWCAIGLAAALVLRRLFRLEDLPSRSR